MPISQLLYLRTARLTNQQVADFALEEDRAARAARRRGDSEAAAAHEYEVAQLSRLLQ